MTDAAVAALILLLIIILPCIVRILRQSIQRLATELHLAVLWEWLPTPAF